MKKFSIKTLMFSVAAALVFTACQNEDLTGDQNEIKGKPGILSLQLKGAKLKTKSIWSGSENPDGEKVITDFTVFVLKGDGSKDVAKYYTSFTDGMVVDIPVSTNATSVKVIANLGDLTSLTDSTAIYSETLDLTSSDGSVYGDLAQTGSSLITWNGNSPSATVPLKFVPSRISFEEVTLFGLTISPVNITDTTSMDAANLAAFKSAEINEIAITSIFILNTPATTYLLPRTSGTWNEALFTNDNQLYNGDNLSSDGQYYPISPLSSSYTSTLGESWSASIPSSSGDYPYFYVWENKDNGILTSGITLAVIACDVDFVATPGMPEQRYFTVVLDNTINSQTSAGGNTYPNYSTKRGVHYRITANIKSMGKANPYSPYALSIKLNQTSWDDMMITATL